MNKKRVVVTGFATINPLGTNIEDFWENSLKGKSGVSMIKKFDIPNDMSQIAGQVVNFNFWEDCTEQRDKYLDRSCQFAIAASSAALHMAKLHNLEDSDTSRFNVHIATAISNIEKMEETLVKWSDNGNRNIPFIEEPEMHVADFFHFNTVSKLVAEKFNFRGEHSVIATGCTGGVDAIGLSLQTIRDGDADVVITGSTEAPITPLVVSSFSKINATSRNNEHPERASRPFDKDRDGFVLGEGCGVLILEELDHALDRGATIFAEIKGYGSCSNAQHMTDIPEDGASIAKSMLLALEDAELTPCDINYVNLHGSSTKQNDIAEANAMRNIFEDNYSDIPVSSLKSQIGHALSASNSIEIVSSIMSLNTGLIPPTINLENKDPKCDLNVVSKAPTNYDINNILKNSSGFSGIHSSLVLGKFVEGTNG